MPDPSCVCTNYMKGYNVALFITSVTMAVLMSYFISTGAASPVLVPFSGLASTYMAKWCTFIAAALLIILSITGLRFASTKDRGLGCLYLTFFLLAVALQLLLVVLGAYGSLSYVNHISHELTDKEAPAETNAIMIEAMRDTFETFANRFNNWKTPRHNRQCSFAEPQSHLMAITEQKLPWLRRGAARAPLRKLHSKDECVPEVNAVICKKDKSFGSELTQACHSNGFNAAFTKSCTSCREFFWSQWNIDWSFKDRPAEKEHLHNLFKREAGTAYCRCLGAFIALVDAHYPYIAVGGIVFVCLEVLLLGVLVFLIALGPRANLDRSYTGRLTVNKELEMTSMQTMVFETSDLSARSMASPRSPIWSGSPFDSRLVSGSVKPP